jgi:putative ATP-binding cassette transporter
LAQTLIGRWLADRHFYQLTIVHTRPNPEARIAEDGRLAIELWLVFTGCFKRLLVAIPSSASCGSSAAL